MKHSYLFHLSLIILFLVGCTTQPTSKFTLDPQDFQKKIDGKTTGLYILKNDKGMEFAVTNYGARAVGLMAPDRNGQFGDVLTGFKTLDEYIDCPEPFHGPVVGRVGNRIAKGKFTLDGKTYSVPVNNGPNHLHGGPEGFHHQVWEVINVTENSIDLRHVSVDGEMGYPGELTVDLRYELTNENELILSYKATTNQKTVVNLTWHPFFNLAGEGSTINDHLLMINADHYTPVDATLIPLGKHAPVANTPFDFRTAKPIGRDLSEQANNIQLQHGAGYDHNWVLNTQPGESMRLAARLEDPTSGRVMEIRTEELGLQFYGGNFFDGSTTGKNGKSHIYRGAMALEPQMFPDAPNQPNFPSIVLEPGEVYQTQSVYHFSTN
jgi:aldose 1-epimerase